MAERTNDAGKRPRLPEELEFFSGDGGGIESWLGAKTPDEVVERLSRIEREPIAFEHLNQLLILSHEAGHSRGFFKYYWFSIPPAHPYDISALKNYSAEFRGMPVASIISSKHLAWGMERLYVDALLFFGNIRECYRQLRNKSFEELENFFASKCFDTDQLLTRSDVLPLEEIQKDDRYLIAEMACKTYDDNVLIDLKGYLRARYKEIKASGEKTITSKHLLNLHLPVEKRVQPKQLQLKLETAEFSLVEMLDEEILDDSYFDEALAKLDKKFKSAREKALRNTRLYLSMIFDLDAYVATSMRNRDDFRLMADRCGRIFGDARIQKLKLRYFDPTMSGADSHEDKGLIECLMVKCAKLLIYMAGTKDSYGKDAEAAMALSMGKPVIFLCDAETKASFYRDVHPLSRLIDFQTGVAVGAMVTDKDTEVPLLVERIFSNKMRYELDRKRENYWLLREQQTSSVIRVQTDNKLLTEAFWNYYRSEASTNS